MIRTNTDEIQKHSNTLWELIEFKGLQIKANDRTDERIKKNKNQVSDEIVKVKEEILNKM